MSEAKSMKRINKTDAGNGSYGICRVSNVLRSPSPDPRHSPNPQPAARKMLTAKDIADAKRRLNKPEGHHEHDDCIRIAYEWLDAQVKTKGFCRRQFALKHLIERWAGRYVSQSDVETAALLHPDVRGDYPFFNISSRLTEPSTNRLAGIGEAGKHYYRESHKPKDYSHHENSLT